MVDGFHNGDDEMKDVVGILLAKGMSSGNLRFRLQGTEYNERGRLCERFILQSKVGGAWITISQHLEEVKEDVSA